MSSSGLPPHVPRGGRVVGAAADSVAVLEAPAGCVGTSLREVTRGVGGPAFEHLPHDAGQTALREPSTTAPHIAGWICAQRLLLSSTPSQQGRRSASCAGGTTHAAWQRESNRALPAVASTRSPSMPNSVKQYAEPALLQAVSQSLASPPTATGAATAKSSEQGTVFCAGSHFPLASLAEQIPRLATGPDTVMHDPAVPALQKLAGQSTAPCCRRPRDSTTGAVDAGSVAAATRRATATAGFALRVICAAVQRASVSDQRQTDIRAGKMNGRFRPGCTCTKVARQQVGTELKWQTEGLTLSTDFYPDCNCTMSVWYAVAASMLLSHF